MLLSGEKSKRYGIEGLNEALAFFERDKKTGYVRITEERDGLFDCFLIFFEGERVACLTEGEKVAEYGRVALESFSGEHKEAVVETYLVSRRGIDTLFESAPQAFFVEMKKSREVPLPKKGVSFKIAGVEIKTLAPIRQTPTEKLDPSLIKELESVTGCVRFVCENEGILEEGCIISGGKINLALFESEEIAFGPKALLNIMLMTGKKGIAEVYSLDISHVEELGSLFSASRIKDLKLPTDSPEFNKERMKRDARGALGLRQGRLVLESPFSGAFSLDIFLRTVAEKKLTGYLSLEGSSRFGIVYFEEGASKASLLYADSVVFGREAYDGILGFKEEGMLRFYQTPIVQIKEKRAIHEITKQEEAEMLMRRMAQEMGQDIIKEIKGAQKFKRMFAEKREGESGGAT